MTQQNAKQPMDEVNGSDAPAGLDRRAFIKALGALGVTYPLGRLIAPRVVLADECNLPPDEVLQLVDKFEPVLHFHPDEPYRPIHVDQFVSRAALWHIKDRKDPTTWVEEIPENDISLDHSRTYLGANPDYIDNDRCMTMGGWVNEETKDRANLERVRERFEEFENEGYYYFAEFVELDGTLRRFSIIKYFYFYPANNKRLVIPKAEREIDLSHEGDWEIVCVVLQGGEPVLCLTSEAPLRLGADSLVLHEWNEMELADTHPLIYVSRGSHENHIAPDCYSWNETGQIDQLIQIIFERLGDQINEKIDEKTSALGAGGAAALVIAVLAAIFGCCAAAVVAAVVGAVLLAIDASIPDAEELKDLILEFFNSDEGSLNCTADSAAVAYIVGEASAAHQRWDREFNNCDERVFVDRTRDKWWEYRGNWGAQVPLGKSTDGHLIGGPAHPNHSRLINFTDGGLPIPLGLDRDLQRRIRQWRSED